MVGLERMLDYRGVRLTRFYCSTLLHTVEHSYNKPEIPGQTVCYKQEFVISEQFPMRYCSTWLRSLLCYIKKFLIEEFVKRVFHCTYDKAFDSEFLVCYRSVHLHPYTTQTTAQLVQVQENGHTNSYLELPTTHS